MTFDIKVKHVHDPADASDGQRVLVDRLWPRGISKKDAKLALWLKDIAPSTELRKWFGHEPERWEEFRRRYVQELNAMKDPLRELRELSKHGDVTLLFGAHERRYNNAVALAQYWREKG